MNLNSIKRDELVRNKSDLRRRDVILTDALADYKKMNGMATGEKRLTKEGVHNLNQLYTLKHEVTTRKSQNATKEAAKGFDE